MVFFDESYNVTCPYLFSSIGVVLRECHESCGLVRVMIFLNGFVPSNNSSRNDH